MLAIYIAPRRGGDMVACDLVRAVPGRGLEGDRYFARSGTFSEKPGAGREVTLVESEALEAARREHDLDLPPGASRRNVVTAGVALNDLVGREFAVGEAVLRGVRLCEPCDHLDRLTGLPCSRVLVHRCGLRAEVLREGIIRPGDAVREQPADAKAT